FFSSRRRHTRFSRDWSSDVCSSDLALPLPLLEKLLGFLRAERLVEVPRRGSFDADVRYALTELGRARANEALRRNQYVGPAPVRSEERRVGKEGRHRRARRQADQAE